MRGAWGQASTVRKKNGKAKGRPVAQQNTSSYSKELKSVTLLIYSHSFVQI